MKTKITLITFLFLITVNAQTLINESFNSTIIPAGWTKQSLASGNNTWNFQNGFGAYMFSGTVVQNEWLITPSFNTQSFSSMYLQLYLKIGQMDMITNNTSDFFIKVSIDNGANWSTIWNDTQFEYSSSGSIDYISLDVTPYVGNPNVKFAFNITSNGQGNNSANQLYEVVLGSCPKPRPNNNYPLNWENESNFIGTYIIEYGPTGFIQGSGNLITGITGNSYSFPNPICDSFDYYVRANCGTSYSTWSRKISINAVSGISVSNVQTSQATINWTSPSSEFTLEYGPNDFVSGTGITITGITSISNNYSYVLQNLNSCSIYTVRIKPTCSNQDFMNSTNLTTQSANASVQYTIPFTETFENNFCELGYVKVNSLGSATSGLPFNNLILSSTNDGVRVKTRSFNLTQGVSYQISFKALKDASNPLNLTFDLVNTGAGNTISIYESINNLNISNFVTYIYEFTPSNSGIYFSDFEIPSGNGNIYIDDFSISQTLSNIDFDYKNIKFYPNPTSSTIAFYGKIKNLQIFDISGKKVFEHDSESLIFNISDLPKGVYIMKGKTFDNHVFIEKLVKI